MESSGPDGIFLTVTVCEPGCKDDGGPGRRYDF